MGWLLYDDPPEPSLRELLKHIRTCLIIIAVELSFATLVLLFLIYRMLD